MSWTTPADLKAYVRRQWERGHILAASLGEGEREPLFPLERRLKRPGPREIAADFGAVMDWVADLQAASREQVGFGYDLRWQQVRNRVQGTNDIPVAAIFPTEEDALRFIGRQTEAQEARKLMNTLLARQPALAPWLSRRPLQVLERSEDWEGLLAVLDWFQANPRPGLYLRQLDIPGVDTKFVESRRRLLTELLDAVLPAEAIDTTATGVRGFNQRYGLRDEPPLVRFRLLDSALYIQGLNDLAVPPDQFARLNLPVERVFITENLTNGLAFPPHPRALVIFGLGYGLERLARIPWLQQKEILYWGDIDTHGFGILNRLRALLPQARSFLMDRETLLAHRPFWVTEPADKRYTGEPDHLTPAERALLDDLRHNRLGRQVRLEQERIGFQWVKGTLETK